MAIDYQKLLKDAKVKKILGKSKLAEALSDEDFLPNLISEESTDVLTVGWDGDFPGMSGANYINKWNDFYFFSSSDLEDEGPFDELDEVLDLECFQSDCASPTLDSDVLSVKELKSLAEAMVAEGESVFINGTCYHRRKDRWVKTKE